jgi:hypothetical protein
VRVENEAQIAHRQIYLDTRTGESRSRTICGGENYVVKCPFCADKTGHLYFSHVYGEFDQETGETNLHLAHCFHDCLKDNPGYRHQLAIMVFGQLAHNHRLRSQPRAVLPVIEECSTSPITPVELPKPFSPIVELPSTHSARQYLFGRGFDVREL